MNQLENCQARYRSNTWMGRTHTDGPNEFEPPKFDCSCFIIHLQADRQTNGQIFYRCIDLRLVQSFNYLHASAFCAPSLRQLFQNQDDYFDFLPTCETISMV